MIYIKNGSLSFGEQTLFNNLNVSIDRTYRVGLCGLNGAGKSTLLSAIAGKIQLDEGSISIDQSGSIAYMPQEVVLQSDRTILDEVLSANQAWWKLKTAYESLHEQSLADPTNQTLAERASHTSITYFETDPGALKAEALTILAGLGFDTQKTTSLVTSLSTGWKMRVVLAKLLFQKAAFYLFDEPTNHLDIVAQTWFLRFLQQNNFGFMMVCHEKKFLNHVCSHILALEQQAGTLYSGNYDAYIKQRNAHYERLEMAYVLQQKEIAAMEKTINRFRASASKAALAQSMIKKLAKIERIVLPQTVAKPSFSFPLLTKSARVVLTVNDCSYAYEHRTIFEHCSFALERGQKVAIVAPNGGGKTTLISMLQGKLHPQSGSFSWGEQVKTAFFAQDQLKTLSLEETVLANATKHANDYTTQGVRTLLGNFLFQGEDVFKLAKVLSGGERNRLGMAQVLLQNANTLVLDEPTNHLDITAKDILAQALIQFDGTILFVSHDQDFVNQVATHILELQPNRSLLFHGNYDAYVFQKQQAPPLNSAKIETSPSKSVPNKPNQKQEQPNKQALRVLEKSIIKVEDKIKRVQHSFLELTYNTPAFDQATKQLKQLEQELAELTTQWEQLIE